MNRNKKNINPRLHASMDFKSRGEVLSDIIFGIVILMLMAGGIIWFLPDSSSLKGELHNLVDNTNTMFKKLNIQKIVIAIVVTGFVVSLLVILKKLLRNHRKEVEPSIDIQRSNLGLRWYVLSALMALQFILIFSNKKSATSHDIKVVRGAVALLAKNMEVATYQNEKSVGALKSDLSTSQGKIADLERSNESLKKSLEGKSVVFKKNTNLLRLFNKESGVIFWALLVAILLFVVNKVFKKDREIKYFKHITVSAIVTLFIIGGIITTEKKEVLVKNQSLSIDSILVSIANSHIKEIKKDIKKNLEKDSVLFVKSIQKQKDSLNNYQKKTIDSISRRLSVFTALVETTNKNVTDSLINKKSIELLSSIKKSNDSLLAVINKRSMSNEKRLDLINDSLKEISVSFVNLAKKVTTKEKGIATKTPDIKKKREPLVAKDVATLGPKKLVVVTKPLISKPLVAEDAKEKVVVAESTTPKKQKEWFSVSEKKTQNSSVGKNWFAKDQ